MEITWEAIAPTAVSCMFLIVQLLKQDSKDEKELAKGSDDASGREPNDQAL